MKKAISYSLLALSFLLPNLAKGAMLAPTMHLHVILNTTEKDGVFDFKVNYQDNSEPSKLFEKNFQITTQNLSGESFIDIEEEVDMLPLITLSKSAGSTWPVQSVSCVNDTYDPLDVQIPLFGVMFYYYPNTTTTCTFTSQKQEITKTPIIIIPGVLGTDLLKGNQKLWANPGKMFTDIGDQFMDPLKFLDDLTPEDFSIETGNLLLEPFEGKHYYDQILQEFQNQNYVLNQDLFTFPYDWRYGVSGKTVSITTVDLLKQKIDDILAQTHADKVDVVAHSTGGLLLKKYISTYTNNHHVNKAVFVGVPNLGAPKAIKVLLEGDSFNISFLADEEMKKIAQNLPVIYDLAPSRKYVNTVGVYFEQYDNFNPDPDNKLQLMDFDQTKQLLANRKLVNVQAMENSEALHTEDFDNFDVRTAGVDAYNIVGCKSGTLNSMTYHIGPFNPYLDASEDISGDGTVPMASAVSIPVSDEKKFYVLKADHGKMPSQDGIRQKIVNIISGSNLDTGKNFFTRQDLNSDPNKCKLKGHWWQIFSPLSIEVVDQNGNRSGLADNGSIQNDIPGADYEIFGDHKFVFVPTDEDQTYSVKLKGTGSGTFTFKASDITDDKITGTQIFSAVPVTTSLSGNLQFDSQGIKLNLDNNSDGTVDSVVTPSAVLNSEQSQDLVAPSTTPVTSGDVGKAGYYRSNVTLGFEVRDPVMEGRENETSGVLKTQYNLDNKGFVDYNTSSPVIITSEGVHNVQFYSIDRAGNKEPEQSIKFTIDKTAPELAIKFNPDLQDIEFKGQDNMSSSTDVTVKDYGDSVSAQDLAGNTVLLKLKNKNRKKEHRAAMQSIAYNGQQAGFGKIGFSFSWEGGRQGSVKELKQQASSNNGSYVKAEYEHNRTELEEKKQRKENEKKLSGMILLKLSTSRGDISWTY